MVVARCVNMFAIERAYMVLPKHRLLFALENDSASVHVTWLSAVEMFARLVLNDKADINGSEYVRSVATVLVNVIDRIAAGKQKMSCDAPLRLSTT